MKYKVELKDFEVNEIYNLEELSKKDEERGDIYYYFILKKINYTGLKAIEKVSNIFKVNPKFIHFAGTKDRFGITTQLISLTNIKKSTFENNLNFFNSKLGPDLNLQFIGKFKSRLNLGDNLGNNFIITLRDLDEEEFNKINQNINLTKKNGVLNYFDEQRFGFAGNSHIIGKYILQNNLEFAVKEILTSIPLNNPKEDAITWVNLIKENWENVINSNQKVLNKLINEAPKFYKVESFILKHLKEHKNDFPGALRVIHKKLRTLYINAYQSYLFNEVLNSNINLDSEIQLMNSELDLSSSYGTLYNKLLQKDNLSQDSFNLNHMPELKPIRSLRKTKIFPSNLKVLIKLRDDLFESKFKIILEFDLESGAYATNVIKQLLK